MPIIDYSVEDLAGSRIIVPSWYRVVCETAEDSLSSKGDSTNTLIRGKVLFNADTGDKEFAGPTPYWNFNTKAKWASAGFFNALDGHEVKPGERRALTTEGISGKQLDVFIENDVYDGRTINRINHKYRSVRE